MIEVESLVKWYGPNLAVDNLNFTIPQGQVVGFLGPNGAGKSTTLRMLTGYIPPTSGRATIDGYNVLTQSHEARKRLGYLPENTPLYPEMRVEEYLAYRGKLLKMPRSDIRKRIDAVCDRCGLSAVRRRQIGFLSKGNRQRVGLAQALLHEPPVLVLDEPTAGLDPNQIGQFRQLIADLRGKHTVILSTHILPEVEKTADRVLIIARGRVVAEGSPEELREQVATGSQKVVVELKAPKEEAVKAVNALTGVKQIDAGSVDGWTTMTITPTGATDLREPIGKLALGRGWQVRQLLRQSPSLEEMFVQITAQQSQAVAS